MTRRNVWLSYQEWVLICEEWSDLKWHPFQLSKKEIKYWEEARKEYKSADQKCFERVSVYHWLDNTQNPIVFNALCRENYRGQDMSNVMDDVVSFVGLIINYDDNKNCFDKVTETEWEDHMNKIKEYMDKSGKSIWFARDIMEVFYQECMPQVLVSQ